MQKSLHHRGPDDAAVLWHAHDAVGLAHTRLSVIDVSPLGHQPMHSASGRFVTAYNGEIVNAPVLAQQLRALGVNFRGHSDTEVMLAAFEAWGVNEATQRFAGMFAFAVHDRRERVLHLVRDRVGIKPMHFAWIGGEPNGVFAFASEVRALLQVPGFNRELNHGALAGYFQHGCVTGGDCIWKGVHKLRAGHRLQLDCASGKIQVCCYWDALQVAKSGCSRSTHFKIGAADEADEADKLDALLRGVVKENLESDVPLAFFLSGGVDSASVLAQAVASGAHSLQAFTVGFDDAAFDERNATRATAAALGVQLQELHATPSDLLSAVPLMTDVYDEPFSDSSQIATYFICKLMRRHAKVALSGDGGDEVFGGYHRHVHAANAWGALRNIPAPLRGAFAGVVGGVPASAWDTLAAAVRPVLPRSLRVANAGERVHKWARMLSSRDEAQAYERVTSLWGDDRVVRSFDGGALWQSGDITEGGEVGGALLRSGDMDERSEVVGESWWHADAAMQLPDYLRRMQYMDQAGYLVDDVLTKVDRASMANSLEVRVPLLDHRVVEFAWALPAHMKVRNGRGKWLLRQVLARHVPKQLMRSPKSGFAVPLAAWLRGPLRDWAGDLLSRTQSDDVLDANVVARLFEAFDRGNREVKGADNFGGARGGSAPLANAAAQQIWTLVMYRAWSDRWRRAL